MKRIDARSYAKMFSLTLIVVVTFVTLRAQPFTIDTRELDRLIDEWNFAHQKKSMETFDQIYGESVLLNGRTVTHDKALEQKSQTFRFYPNYDQRVSKIRYTPYTSGIVKATFTNEVQNAGTRSGRVHNAYLLFSYDNNAYKVVGESDSLTDKKVGYKEELGEAMDLSGQSKDTTGVDAPTPKSVYRPSSILTNLNTSRLFSEDTIPISYRTITIVSSLLLVIFVALIFSVAANKRGRSEKMIARGKSSTEVTRVETHAFQRFVVTLFDPLYFNLLTSQHANSHHYKNIDLEFQFRKADVVAFVALKCIYLRERLNGSFQPLNENVIGQLQSLEQESGETQFYLVIAMGGKPDDPAETYLVPVAELPTGPVSYSSLQAFRKHGMFFYNASVGELR